MSKEKQESGLIYGYICDRCGNDSWETIASGEEGTEMLEEIWGSDIIVCHKCGAVRHREELMASDKSEA